MNINGGGKLIPQGLLNLVNAAILGFILLAFGVVGYGFLVEPGWVKVENVRLKLSRLARVFSGLRIAQISDIHMGGWMNSRRFQHVAELILAQKPDLLLITGDFLYGHSFTDASRDSIQDVIKVLAPLAKSIPSFAVLGNHDYWTNSEAIREMLSICGVMDLTNTVHTLTRGCDNLHLCGVDDVWAGDVRLDEVVAQLIDNSTAILLAHEPDFADWSAATHKFDLQISGHTHGGQVGIPFFGAPVLPYLGRKYPRGLYKVGKMFQYTNRGVGMHGLAIRLNCPPEITLFTLEGDV